MTEGVGMNEKEWLACADPRLWLVYLEDKSTNRKARLYTCAIGRFLWPYLGDDRCRNLIDVAEKHADHDVDDNELHTASEAAFLARRGTASRIAEWAGDRGPWQAARMAVVSIQSAQTETDARDWRSTLLHRSRAFLRDIFGNPFRPIALDPRWLTSTVVDIAQAIYLERAFDKMPILADALMDAGCDSEDILNHCRGDGPHVRGCWVVDLLLGKE